MANRARSVTDVVMLAAALMPRVSTWGAGARLPSGMRRPYARARRGSSGAGASTSVSFIPSGSRM